MVAENCTTNPLHKAQNLMTYLLSAPAHPPLYFLTSPLQTFFLPGTRCFWTGTQYFSQDESQDSLTKNIKNFQIGKFTAMIILHFHLQPQFKNELFHILHIRFRNLSRNKINMSFPRKALIKLRGTQYYLLLQVHCFYNNLPCDR